MTSVLFLGGGVPQESPQKMKSDVLPVKNEMACKQCSHTNCVTLSINTSYKLSISLTIDKLLNKKKLSVCENIQQIEGNISISQLQKTVDCIVHLNGKYVGFQQHSDFDELHGGLLSLTHEQNNTIGICSYLN